MAQRPRQLFQPITKFLRFSRPEDFKFSTFVLGPKSAL